MGSDGTVQRRLAADGGLRHRTRRARRGSGVRAAAIDVALLPNELIAERHHAQLVSWPQLRILTHSGNYCFVGATFLMRTRSAPPPALRRARTQLMAGLPGRIRMTNDRDDAPALCLRVGCADVEELPAAGRLRGRTLPPLVATAGAHPAWSTCHSVRAFQRVLCLAHS